MNALKDLEFAVVSGRITISDPCYEEISERLNCEIKAKKGTWKAEVDYNDEYRCKNLIASCLDFNKLDVKRMKNFGIGVDSGQAGVFDSQHYRDDKVVENCQRIHGEIICEDEPWYSICCDRTLSKDNAGSIPYGVVSSSGYGDGCYDVMIYYNEKEEAIKVEIEFIDEDNS